MANNTTIQVDQPVQVIDASATDRLIVKFKDGVSQTVIDTYETSPSIESAETISPTGTQVWDFAANVLDQKISELLKTGYFEYVERDYTITVENGAIVPNDPSFSQQWSLDNTGQTGGTADADIDAPEAWALPNGSSNLVSNSNMVIGVIDTGVDYTHPDLVNNIWTNPGEIAGDHLDNDGNGFVDDVHGWDFAYGDNDPSDVYGHGTHVAGTIAAEGNNGIGVTGVAWHAQIMPIKFLNDSGSGYLSDAIAAINYATMMGVKITNNSWGGGGYTQALSDAIKNAGDHGALFIAAAGNSARNIDSSPAYPAGYTLPNIISVAATTSTDALAPFSNTGPTNVDLGAPGSYIYSTLPISASRLGSNYGTLSGTSMASPHVAGAVALLWSEHPNWTADHIKAVLLANVDPIASLAGKTVTGGRLNLEKAVEFNTPPTGTVDISGTASLGQTLTATNTLADDDGLGTISYQWRAGGTNISGATATTYTITLAEVGKVIDVVASYVDGHGVAESVVSASVSRVGLTPNDDSFIAGSSSESIDAADGDDVIYAMNGNDTIQGSTGDDSLYGGSGNDSLFAGSALALNPNDGNNKLFGGSGNDLLYAGTGDDLFDGGSGTDTVSYELYTNPVQVDLNGTGWQNTSATNMGQLLSIENLVGSAGNDVLIGNKKANVLNGSLGSDTLTGGDGNDTYVIDNSGDSVVETNTSATEIDTVQTSISWSAGTRYVENITLTGTSAINATGNTLNNTLIGNDAANILDGGTGIDTMTGGLGNDTYIVDSTGDSVVESSTLLTEIDSVQSSVSWNATGTYVENITLTGSAAINALGNDLNNILVGNAAINSLYGFAGNDQLNGGAGADSLYGGDGNDTYTVDNTGDLVVETNTSTTEIDTVNSSVTWSAVGRYVENINLTGTSGIYATGNELNNVLLGNTGANSISGGTGNDTLNGGLGYDTLTGGSGQDIFQLFNPPTSNVEKMTDFSPVDDTIQLLKSVYTSLSLGVLPAASFRSGAGFTTAADADDYLIYNTSNGYLYYDAGGNSAGSAASVQIALLGTPYPALTSADFVVV